MPRSCRPATGWRQATRPTRGPAPARLAPHAARSAGHACSSYPRRRGLAAGKAACGPACAPRWAGRRARSSLRSATADTQSVPRQSVRAPRQYEQALARKGERTRNVPRLAQSSGSGSDGGVATQIVRHLLGVRGRHVEAVGAAVAHGLHQPVPVQRAPAERAGPAVDLPHHACGNSASRSGSQAAESSGGSDSSIEQQNSERQQQ